MSKVEGGVRVPIDPPPPPPSSVRVTIFSSRLLELTFSFGNFLAFKV